MSTTVTASFGVAAPAEATWAVVTDWRRQGDWMPQTVVVVDPDAPSGLGAKLTARSGIGPLAIVDEMIVDVWDPPRRCEVRHLGRVVTGRSIFEVESIGEGRSRFTWHEVLHSRGLRRWLDPAAGPATKLLLTVAVRRLARLVEQRDVLGG